jgi:hypothetical protein
MGTGDNVGTWGNVTNTNLGTALEEAIVGSADVPFSGADVTLTLSDSNSSQTARNMRLNLTGSVSATQNLVVPAIEKVYLVNNNLSFAITVKNSTGTGIAVPAGKTMWVYNNGTNVVDAVTHLTSLTLASALPIASGGTGSTSTTYCNLQANVTGILPNGNTTASSSNGAATIVARDGSGNFTANTITANLTGNVTGDVTGNVTGNVTATNVSASNFRTANFTITESGGVLQIRYGSTVIMAIDSGGNVTSIANITAYGTI